MILFKIEDDEVYSGSKLFNPLAEKVGVSIDKLNFLIAQLTALLLSIIYRSYFKSTSSNLKYLAVLVPGFLLGYFEFGYKIWNLWILGMICYILILTCNPKNIQNIVLFVSILYLSYLHVQRQINSYASYVIDITVPCMIMVQKITSLTFSIHDGMSKKNQELTEEQKKYSINKIPSLLEYYSYIFQFPTLLSGPFFYYKDFVNFINGTTEKEYLMDKEKISLPSRKFVVIQKLIVCFVFMFFLLFLEPLFPINRIYDDKFLNENNFMTILFYIYLSTTCARFKYYHAWKLGEAISISAGFGLIKNKSSKNWDYISSVDILGFELSNNFYSCLTSWNTMTQDWLRRISYERSHKYRVIKTYMLSAVWHGFYPGYYLTFISGGFLTNASRVVRKLIRPHFQKTKFLKNFYNFLTFIVTKLILSYIVFPFVILEFYSSIKVYSRLYFGGHLAILAVLFLIPLLLKNKK